MKRIKLAAGILAVLMLPSCSLLPEEETFEAAPVIKSYEAPAYTMAYVERENMEKNQKIACTYVPVQTEKLAFELSGEYVDEVFVETGDYVQCGQVLAQLRLGNVQDQIDSSLAKVTQVEMQLRQLDEDRALAEKRARLSAATPEAAAEALEALAESYDRQAQSLNDSLYLANCQYEEYCRRKRERQIIAGLNGTVTYVRTFTEGAKSALNERVVTIADSTLSLFRADTDQWAMFHPGDEYVITVNKTEYDAVVADPAELGIEPPERVEGKKAYVYLTLKQPALELEENDHGSLTLILDTRTDVLTLPEDAVSTMNGRCVVYYLDEQGIKRYREVETGLLANKRLEITAGLEEGDCVIVN